jgi:hypothetical protein
MIIISPVFDDGGSIPRKFTCDGGNISPELQIENVPAEAKSLALIVHDPDAPMEGGYTHWVLLDIDPATRTIKEDSVVPGSVEGMRSQDETGYTGPCPPSGTHHYHFELYALDAPLGLPFGAPMQSVRDEIARHCVARAELVGLYAREK